MTKIRSVAVWSILLTGAGLAWSAEGRFERTLQVGGPVELEIDSDSGSITVRAGTEGQVHVTGVIRSSRNLFGGASEETVRRLEATPPIEQAGNRIQVGRTVAGVSQNGVSIHYMIEVPVETRVRSRSDSGGQEISGVRGPVDAEADSGGLRLKDIGGDVRAKSDSGRIEVDGVDGELVARADSGGIRAVRIAGKIDAETDSGGIRLEQIAPADIRAEADSGGIHVRIPEGAGYEVNAETDSGGISIQAPVTVQGTIRKNKVEGRIRDGQHILKLKTDSGGIRIYEGSGEI